MANELLEEFLYGEVVSKIERLEGKIGRKRDKIDALRDQIKLHQETLANWMKVQSELTKTRAYETCWACNGQGSTEERLSENEVNRERCTHCKGSGKQKK